MKSTVEHTFRILDMYDPKTQEDYACQHDSVFIATEVETTTRSRAVGMDLRIVVTKQQLLIISDPANSGSAAITTDIDGEITAFFCGKNQKLRAVGNSIAIHRSSSYKVHQPLLLSILTGKGLLYDNNPRTFQGSFGLQQIPESS